MASNGKDNKAVIMSARVRAPGQTLLFGRARLLHDRIILTGLFHKEVISLSEVTAATWQGDELRISLGPEDRLILRMRGAGKWKFEIQRLCGFKDPAINLRP